jgi:hypothetical protein
MNSITKVSVLIIAAIYGVLIFKFPESKALTAVIPLVTAIISLVICQKSENFSFSVSLTKNFDSRLNITLNMHNNTMNIYHIHKIKIGNLPEEIMEEVIIQPNSFKTENISAIEIGNLPRESRYVKGKLYVAINANNKEYSVKKILNPCYDLAASRRYKFMNAIREVFRS